MDSARVAVLLDDPDLAVGGQRERRARSDRRTVAGDRDPLTGLRLLPQGRQEQSLLRRRHPGEGQRAALPERLLLARRQGHVEPQRVPRVDGTGKSRRSPEERTMKEGVQLGIGEGRHRRQPLLQGQRPVPVQQLLPAAEKAHRDLTRPGEGPGAVAEAHQPAVVVPDVPVPGQPVEQIIKRDRRVAGEARRGADHRIRV